MCFDFRIPQGTYSSPPPLPPQNKRVHGKRRDDDDDAAAVMLPVFSSLGFTKDGERALFWALPTRSLSPYIRLDLSVCGPRNVVGVPSPSPSLFLSQPPSSSLETSVILSLFHKHYVPSLHTLPLPLSSPPLPSPPHPLLSSRLIALPPSSRAREAKRRLFRRECFHRNAETVLIAGCLA